MLATPINEPVEVYLTMEHEDETMSLNDNEGGRVFEEGRESPPVAASMFRPRGGDARRQTSVATPRGHRRLSMPSQRLSGGSLHLHRNHHVSPRGARGSADRRRRLRRSPPSQRRSEMAKLTERFIAIEERRVDAELAIARSQEMFAQGHSLVAEALDKFTNMTPLIIEAIKQRRAPSTTE